MENAHKDLNGERMGAGAYLRVARKSAATVQAKDKVCFLLFFVSLHFVI